MAQAVETPDTSLVETARAALGRHEWRAAFDAITKADAAGGLTPEALEVLAQAAWWTGQLSVAIDARERAYPLAVKAGDVQRAVQAAVNLGVNNLQRLSLPVARAWLKKAEKLLEGAEESAGHGWLAAAWALHNALNGDSNAALEQATRANDIASRIGDRDLEPFSLSQKGAALVALGRVDEGLAAIDEATVSALSGEVDPQTAGSIFCVSIEACSGIGDYRRAAEWTDAQDRWCQREGINGFPGMCRVYRSDIKRLRGAWPEAEAEARLAADELRGFIPGAAGLALYSAAQVRLRRGDLPAAEEALLGAHALGLGTQPAYALLLLAQGKVPEAAASIVQALVEPGQAPSWRAPADSAAYRLSLLPAQSEILLAAGDVTGARAVVDELAGVAESLRTGSAEATAKSALGAVLLAEGDAAGAAARLREAISGWTEIDAPWDAARAQLMLARAYLALGDHGRAAVEARTARATFERLGALPDLRATDQLLSELQAGAPDAPPLGTATARVARAFVFTDIVDSTRLAEVMGDEAWDRIIRAHDHLVRSAVAEQAGEEVKARGDGFFLAFTDADHAIEAAIGIQRRLAAHRDAQGFLPAVRIGIHQAEANRVGLDYMGSGVNQAARIGDVAEGGEVLISASSLAGARHTYAEIARRSVTLRGVSAPVEVIAIDWR